MVVTSDQKITLNNGGSRNFKNALASSTSSVTNQVATATKTLSNENEIQINRLESMTDEEFIQKNLKELMDKKHQEERKANGRLIAVILASLVIFLAIYHTWIRNSRMLTGILVPAVIMLSFVAWVVVLAKRDKAKRQIFEKYLQEVALRNRQELRAKSKPKSKKSKQKKSPNIVLLHYENEINNEQIPLTHFSANRKETKTTTSILKNKDHRKHRKHRKSSNSDGYSTTSSSSSSKQSSHYATKDLRIKRPSIRQKIFRQAGFNHMSASSPKATHTLVQAVINTPVPQCMPPIISGNALPSPATKRKRLQKLNSLQVPTMVRMSSAP